MARIAGWMATGLTAIWFLVHTFVGGPEVAAPLQAADLPEAVMAPAVMVWNMITAILFVSVLLFAWATMRADRGMMIAATTIALAMAAAGIVTAPLTGVGFSLLPQGFLFVLSGGAGGLAALGLKTPGPRE